MIVKPIKTHKITKKDTSLEKILDQYISDLSEKSVVAVTSKIVAICEGRVISKTSISRDELAQNESEYYLPATLNKYGFTISIKHNSFIASGGVDESNGNGYYIPWPGNPQESVNRIRAYLRKKFKLTNLGVIITDSKTTPLRWGVTGFAITHSGFRAVNDLVGEPDIFGRLMHVTKVNVMDGLAAAAVFVMGEASEQTPIAVISDIPHIRFEKNNPSREELEMLHINLEEDIYGPLLTKVEWKKGKKE